MNDEGFRNREGTIKLKYVRNAFNYFITASNLNEVVNLYKEWRDTSEYMPMRLTYKVSVTIDATDLNTTGEIYSNYLESHRIPNTYYKDYVFFDRETMEWELKKSCKRGNDIYINIFKAKYNDSFRELNEKQFFTTVLNKSRKRLRKTKLLYITGTVSQRFCCNCGSPISKNVCECCGGLIFVRLTIHKAWKEFGIYWNSFVTNLREQFKGCEYFRVWQSQENGYPHFHALMYFPNFDFSVVYWKEDKSFRIHNRQKHKGRYVRDRIKQSWKHGYLDIKCCDSLKQAKTDLLKYIVRDLQGGESDLTNALIWFYGKQSYSISKKFFVSVGCGNQTLHEPCNDEFINAEGVIQRNNSKKTLIRIEVFPLIRGDKLYLPREKTYQTTIDTLKKPPPELINQDYFDKFIDSCSVSTFRITGDDVEIVIYKKGEFIE